MSKIFTFSDALDGHTRIVRINYRSTNRPTREDVLTARFKAGQWQVWMVDGSIRTQSSGEVTVTETGLELADGSVYANTPEQWEAAALPKALFENSRIVGPDGKYIDATTHFDPAIHTLEALASGTPGHHPCACKEYQETDLPLDNDDRLAGKFNFRDVWEDTGTGIAVNMDKARQIWMDNIRLVRNAELVKLDLESLRAMEAGSVTEQQRIGKRKQVLRDIPQTFDLTTPNDTPEELKAMWPAELS